jgi:hypothetical protein
MIAPSFVLFVLAVLGNTVQAQAWMPGSGPPLNGSPTAHHFTATDEGAKQRPALYARDHPFSLGGGDWILTEACCILQASAHFPT